MELVNLITKTLVVLTGTIFITIAIHRFLIYHGIINFEFKRVDRIKKIFTVSFYSHLISIASFIVLRFYI